MHICHNFENNPPKHPIPLQPINVGYFMVCIVVSIQMSTLKRYNDSIEHHQSV